MRTPQRWAPANRCAPQRTRGPSPGPGSAATAAGARVSYAAPDRRAGAGRGPKKAHYHTGAFFGPSTFAQHARQPQRRQAQGQGVARGTGRPAAEPTKMQGRRRAKRIKARRRLFYPCILGGRCNALPPPGPGDSPSIGTAAGPAKRQKAGLLTAQCAAPPAQVGGVSDVECPERGRSGAGPTKGRGLGGGYTFQGCGSIGRYAVAPGRESARGRYHGLAVFGDGLGMAGAAAGVAREVGHPRVVILGTIWAGGCAKKKEGQPFRAGPLY